MPDTNAEDAAFSDDAPDAAQTITLDGNFTIDELQLDATGNRSYTINNDGGGEILSLRRWSADLGPNTSAGTQTLTQNAETRYTNATEFQLVADDNTLTVAGPPE